MRLSLDTYRFLCLVNLPRGRYLRSCSHSKHCVNSACVCEADSFRICYNLPSAKQHRKTSAITVQMMRHRQRPLAVVKKTGSSEEAETGLLLWVQQQFLCMHLVFGEWRFYLSELLDSLNCSLPEENAGLALVNPVTHLDDPV